MRVLPAACGICAIVVCAWFALSIRQAHETGRARTILSASKFTNAARAGRVTSLLQNAAVLNPDRAVDILRGQLALQRGNSDQARAIIAAVTRREPQNLDAWLWLARASTNDSLLFFRALERVRALEPRIP